jgi:hypothetical protein
MLKNLLIPPVFCLTLGVTGCGVTSQLHSELSYGATGEAVLAFEDAGIGVLTPAAPTGQESDKQALGDALSTALKTQLPDVRVLALSEMLSAINKAGLAGSYASALAEYGSTGILDREALQAIGEASDVRYLAKLNLGGFEQSSDKRLAIAGIRMFDTWRATIRVHLEVWDSHSGELAWEGNDEVVYAREGVKERPVTFSQVADFAALNLVQKVGLSGTESLDQDPETVAAR